MKTYMQKPSETEKKWVLIDANDKVLGRLATQIASILMGKHKPTYAPHQDGGDFVVVVNAEKVALTGNKANTKIYWSHSTKPGSRKETTYAQMLERKPEEIIRQAVKRMLPKNNLRNRMMKHLKICAGSTHPYAAQKPEAID